MNGLIRTGLDQVGVYVCLCATVSEKKSRVIGMWSEEHKMKYKMEF